MKKHRVVAISMMSFVLTLAVVTAMFMTAQKTSGEVRLTAPVNMTGVWHQVDGTQDENMVAEINHGKIQITLYLGKANGVYWDGSFDFDQAHQNADSFDVVSESNHPDDMFSSQMDNKKFTYKDGVLSYVFKIVGTTRTVELKKEGN